MPSIFNTVLLALHAAALVILSGQSKIHVMASPVPLPPALVSLAADHPPPTGLNATQDTSTLTGKDFARRFSNYTIAAHSSTAQSLHRRDDLWQSYRQAEKNSNNLQSLSKRYRSGENNGDMQRRIVTEARGYQSNFLELQSLLDQLGSNKGLANYDNTNDLETLLKNIVNLNKCLLTEIYDLINDIPVLGPVLGPIFYEIKCILDDILNFCENLTDASINALQPLLKILIGQASTIACTSGVEVLGLCI